MNLDELSWMDRIDEKEPLWWDLDYSRDPRELLTIEEFEKNLKYLGKYPLHYRDGHHVPDNCREADNELFGAKNINVYTGSKVPIVILNIKVKNQELPLFVTARPYTLNEMGSTDEKDTQEKLEDRLKEALEKSKNWDFTNRARNFLPHARGFFKELRGKRIFYYPIRELGEEGNLVKKGLSAIKKDYLFVWNGDTADGHHGIADKARRCMRELRTRRVASCCKTVEWKGLEQVAYDDFKPCEKELVSYYPIRLDGINETIPVAISTRTHPFGKERGLFAVGVFFAYHKNSPNTPEVSVFPFTNKEFAENVSKQISHELNLDIKSVFLERKPGRGKYHVLK